MGKTRKVSKMVKAMKAKKEHDDLKNNKNEIIIPKEKLNEVINMFTLEKLRTEFKNVEGAALHFTIKNSDYYFKNGIKPKLLDLLGFDELEVKDLNISDIIKSDKILEFLNLYINLEINTNVNRVERSNLMYSSMIFLIEVFVKDYNTKFKFEDFIRAFNSFSIYLEEMILERGGVSDEVDETYYRVLLFHRFIELSFKKVKYKQIDGSKNEFQLYFKNIVLNICKLD